MEDKTLHRVLMVEPNKKPHAWLIEPGLEPLQKAVGGYIEAVYPFEDDVAIICNEEGKINGLPLNRALRDENGEIYDILAGTFLVVGINGDEFWGLTTELYEKYYKRFQYAEEFFRMLNGKKIDVVTWAGYEED